MALTQLVLETEYRSAQSELAAGFYRQCLAQSTHYDRAAGYFSSTVFLIVGSNVIEFARRGGKMRLVCSPQLSDSDIEALRQGHANLGDLASARLLEELEQLEAIKAAEFHLRALSTLVAIGSLDIRVAVRAQGYGIFHEKLGVFEDNKGNAVSFIGSANETWKGWHPDGNYEAIEVFCSWTGDERRVEKHKTHFARIWDGQDPSLQVVDFPEAVRRKLCDSAAASLDDLAAPVSHRPTERPVPRRHQQGSIDAWVANGYRGIFKHATGSGKTLTACFAMKPHLDEGGVVLILVPSRLLLDQWYDELTTFFPEPEILRVGAGNDDWRRPSILRSFSSEDRLLGGRIVLATLQTARSDDFLARLRKGAHLLVIADEVHQAGSTENSKVLTIQAGRRLGLSATPERYGDSLGTHRLLEYFGPILQPEYSLSDAIAEKHLVPYEYHPTMVSLSDEEMDEWRAITRQIAVAVGREQSSAGQGSSDFVQRLLIKRSRVAKKASAKLKACQEILRNNYRPHERWLVYCEDQEQLRSVVQQTKTWCKDVLEYHTGMVGSPAATLQWFQQHGGILVAIACLDEGVNIPSVTHALILASSQNPRQFVQRRGRILRNFPDKRLATIFDILVTPEDVDDEPTQRSLLKSELRRAVEFASSATNTSGVVALRLIAVRAGIDPNSVDDSGTEDDALS
jgi:superfamily II DNA or RNA helicase